jgi:hypothetical protein
MNQMIGEERGDEEALQISDPKGGRSTIICTQLLGTKVVRSCLVCAVEWLSVARSPAWYLFQDLVRRHVPGRSVVVMQRGAALFAQACITVD